MGPGDVSSPQRHWPLAAQSPWALATSSKAITAPLWGRGEATLNTCPEQALDGSPQVLAEGLAPTLGGSPLSILIPPHLSRPEPEAGSELPSDCHRSLQPGALEAYSLGLGSHAWGRKPEK